MLCTATTDVPRGDGWVLQPKYDGWRFLWSLDSAGVARAWTRSGRQWDGCFPELDEQLSGCLPRGTILDGELVALRQSADGRVLHDFKAVGAVIGFGCAGLHYVVFDVLALGGKVLCDEPWHGRHAALGESLPERLSCVSLAQVLEPTLKSHRHLVGLGLEGSVFKRSTSRYLPGRRSRSWLKLKARFTEEVVIAGLGPRGEEVERIRCASVDDAVALGWAELWPGEMRRRIAVDRRAWIGRRATVAYSSRAADGELREARVVALLT
jgi:bifunctional non-homologous end joining protein LigD